MATGFAPEDVGGAVTAVTGFEKGSGKTTFLSFALPYARRLGPVAVFSIGVDGRLKERERGASTEIRVEPGDVVMTTESFARASGARFEVLETISGRTALGRLFLGRARRAGSVTLVGSEHFSAMASAVALVRTEGWASSVLIDGAVNRITQVSALGDLRFVFTVRADRSNLVRAASRVRAVAALANLPLAREADLSSARSAGDSARGDEDAENTCRLEGVLTAETIKVLPAGTRRVSVEDFTKIFLEPQDLLRVLERLEISVRRRFGLLGFVVALRDVGPDEFAAHVGPDASSRILFNPYDVSLAGRGAA